MQTILSGIWTEVIDSVSYDNYYIKCASTGLHSIST